MSISKRAFGKTAEGQEAAIFDLVNSNGMTAAITNFGGIVVSMQVPDKNGKLTDVVLGFDKLEDYEKPGPYFGAIIGRHANRIEDSRFTLNGVEYRLYANENETHLHGGLKGFDKVLWQAGIVKKNGMDSLRLTYLSRDGEEGYPGNLNVRVEYTLSEDNALEIEYFAKSDRDTVVNLTNHSYFNLSGHGSGDILRHELHINADRFTVNDSRALPTGEIRPVQGTPMDFTRMTPVGLGIDSQYEQIQYGHGYDHNWVLNMSGQSPEKAAEVYDPASGRVLETYTTQPGVQFYSGNFLQGVHGKDGAVYQKRSGLCLETQHFPNSMKHPNFPSPILRAGQDYHQITIYNFLNR